MCSFYTPWKYQKTFGFMVFSGSGLLNQWRHFGAFIVNYDHISHLVLLLLLLTLNM